VPTWTDPYSDASTGDMMVNIAKLSETVNAKKIGREGYAILLDSQNNVLTHPDETQIGKPIPVPAITDAVTNNDFGSIHYAYKGSQKFLYFTTLKTTGWKIMGNQSNAEVLDATKKMLMAILIIN